MPRTAAAGRGGTAQVLRQHPLLRKRRSRIAQDNNPEKSPPIRARLSTWPATERVCCLIKSLNAAYNLFSELIRTDCHNDFHQRQQRRECSQTAGRVDRRSQ